MFLKHLLAVLKRDVLLYVVFFTGAVVLAVEVMAVRILAPFFGNTIFSFSSVVSVILAALSVGYWHGGRLADKRPDTSFFYRLVGYSGWSIIGIQFASLFVLPVLAQYFSLVVGPLIAAGILFFLPSYLFGLLSPFVVKLRSMALVEQGVGQVSGAVFFSSTLGSIFGSLLSGFVLIPYVGISISMYSMGILVVLVSVLGRLKKKSSLINIFFYFVLLLLGGGTIVNIEKLAASTGNGTVLFSKDGLYEHISVIEDVLNNKNARILRQDRSYSSGITYPEGELLFPYTIYYELYSFFHDTEPPKHALVLGAGTGTVAKKIHEDYGNTEIDIVDIEPILFTLAHEYFLMPETNKIHEHVADGRQFLRNTDQQYDLIFADMYSSLYSLPFQVMTKEYYVLLYSRLADGGVYIGNYIASLDYDPPSMLGSTVSTIREVFEDVYVFAVDSVDIKTQQNFIIVATKGKNLPKLSKENIYRNKNITYRIFANNLLENTSLLLENNKIFTDDLAPVELRTAELIRDSKL